MALDDDIAVLSRVPALGLLERDALRLLAFAGQTRILIAGDILYRKGDPADGGYVVTSGAIALDASEDGSPAGYIAREGALLGEMALFVETVRSATAVAREPASVMKLTRDVMLRVMKEFPQSAVAVRQELGRRLMGLTDELTRVRERLLKIEEQWQSARGIERE